MRLTAKAEKQSKIFLLLSFLYLISINVNAQGYKTVSGIVNGDGVPLDGASVAVKGSSVATFTDANGSFQLQRIPDDAILIVSFIGYHTVEMGVRENYLQISLTKSENRLDSVIAIGYGSQKRANVTVATTNAQLDGASSRSFNSVSEMLQGKAAGVSVQGEGGDPTAAPSIRVRGLGGINGENVLYVVDGSVVSGTPTINPNDVESISVMKDGGAAIYGARASGGVIFITTKKGKRGQFRVEADAKYGVQKAWKLLHSLDALQYAQVIDSAAVHAGVKIPNAFNESVYPQGRITRTDWINEIFRTAPIQEYNLNANGGNERSTFFTSLNYRKMDGILINTQSERYTFRANSDHKITDWLKLGENISYSYSDGNTGNTNSGYTGAILSALYYPPNIPVYDSLGNFSGLPIAYAGDYGDMINPVAYLKRLDIKSPTNILQINPYIEVKLLKNLTYRSNFSLTKRFWRFKEFATRVLEIGKLNNMNSLYQNYGQSSDLLAEQTLTYDNHWNNHGLNVLGGYSFQKYQEWGLGTRTFDFPSEAIYLRYLGNGNQYDKPSDYKTANALSSVFARLNYNYASKYLLSLIGRNDGSSMIPAKNRYQFYYSASAGWLINKEKFLKDVHWLNLLKLRASYGKLGNLGSISPTSAFPLMSQTLTYSGNPLHPDYGYASNNMSNPELQWAESNQKNIGVEVAILNNRLSFNADWFIKQTNKMLIAKPLPSTSGMTGTQWINAGLATDRGIELGLQWNDKIGNDFSYGAYVNFSKLKNNVDELTEGVTQRNLSNNIRGQYKPVWIKVGEPLYSIYAIRTDGLFQTQDEVNNHKDADGKLIQPNAKPGDIKFLKGPGNKGTISNADMVNVGSAYPTTNYSFGLNAAYKGFDMNIFFQGAAGNKIFNGLKYILLNPGGTGQNYNMLTDILNAWTPNNTITNIPVLVLGDKRNNYSWQSDFYVEKGDYMRLKNLSVGYTLNSNLTNIIRLNGLRVYFTANNLLTFTKYSGFDPEIGMNNLGLDAGQYPQAKSFMFGINIKL